MSLSRIGALVAVLLVLAMGCTSMSPYTYTGAGVGGALGAGAGALLDHNNRWRGAMVGGLMGGALGGAATELGRRAADEDARQRRLYGPTNPAGQSQYYDGSGYFQ
jgi:hypothetical protein